jgi:DNA-binding response OmpR family regulator
MPPETPDTTAPPNAAETDPPVTAPQSVLIVEDDADLADLFRLWMRKYCGRDATITVVHTVADCRARLNSHGYPDIVLLDRRLPDGSARTILDDLSRGFDGIAVLVTGVPPDSDILTLPIDDYLVKPIDEERLMKRIGLLERLDAADALKSYADARKASLLEFHLDDPTANPLFRRFAAKWSYDRLEIARVDGRAVVYELYTGGGAEGDREIRVTVAGSLGPDLESLLETGAVEPVGELFPSGDGYAWVEADGTEPSDDDGVIGIYEFACETPERHVADDAGRVDAMSHVELTDVLESAFN